MFKFTVYRQDAWKKIFLIRLYRSLFGTGLKDSKDIIEPLIEYRTEITFNLRQDQLKYVLRSMQASNDLVFAFEEVSVDDGVIDATCATGCS